MLNANPWIPLDIEDSPSPDNPKRSTRAATAATATAAVSTTTIRAWINNIALLLAGALLLGLSLTLLSKSSASSSTAAAAFLRFHTLFLSSGCNASIRHHLRSLTISPHIASSPENLHTAAYVRSSFLSSGLSSHSIDYPVLLSFPSHSSLSILHPNSTKISISISPSQYHAYSPSADIQAEIVYANFGRLSDYSTLQDLGVNVTGLLVLVRYGEIFRGDIVENARLAGAVGVIIYSDPEEYGNGSQGYFPRERWLPPDGVQRGTVYRRSGDPLTPGWASGDGGERLKVEEAELPRIPSMPISARDGEMILRSLGGKTAPDGWRGGFSDVEYKLGPGPSRLHFTYTANHTVSTIRNVFAVITGYEEPDRFVLLGNHRDAWTYGAVDPSSGTATLLETASRLGRLLKLGWKPRRTIVLCSWDAEEFGTIGSTEWVEQNLNMLGAKAVVYLNVDCAVSGPGFFAGATPQLDELIMDVAKMVKDPDSAHGSVYDSWLSASGGAASPAVDRLGGIGSDYVGFLHHAGVPAVDMYFGKSYPVYHSMYDNFEWMEKFGDPDFTRHVAVSSLWGLMALRLADCLLLPFNYKSYAAELQTYSNKVDAALSSANAPSNTTATPLRDAVADFLESARLVSEEAERLAETEPVLPRRMFNDRLMLVERAFLEEGGLPGRTWYKHLVYGPTSNNGYGTTAYPGVEDAIEEASRLRRADKWAAVQHQIWRVARAVRRASSVLRGELT